MKKFVFLQILLVVFLVPVQMSAQVLLPRPQSVEWGEGVFKLTEPFAVENLVGEEAVNPFSQSILDGVEVRSGSQRVLRFAHFDEGTSSEDEAYKIKVSKDTIEILGRSWEGFLRASQTLAQLRISAGIACGIIEDAPTYAWRGVMIDVSRHFFPMEFLKKQVDVLSRFKMNRLHLHLTDAAGWRMEVKRYPRLTSLGAWRTDSLWKTWWNDGKRHYASQADEDAYGGFYTQSELRELVAYAAERGIMIVPEIEMPAHSEEALTAYPELSCTHEPYKQADFCPGNVATYDFLEHVLEEVMDVFPSPYIHIGGDEAGKASWPTCPLCQAKMSELGIEDVELLQAHLIASMGRFLQAHGRKLIGWDEVISDSLTENAIVMVWRGTDKAAEAIEQGCDVILSPGGFCYLDSYQDAPPTQPEAIGGYLPLEKVYSFVPGEGLPDETKAHILGVQGNLWTEYVPTTSHAEYMLYPRALALAEIGWRGGEIEGKDFDEFRSRAEFVGEQLRRELNVNAFALSSERGERAERSDTVAHKAFGKTVTYNLPYNSLYAAAGEGSLTDGLRGGWANNDGRWQGFIRGKRFDVVIDLGEVTEVKSVSADFMQACGPEIFFPSAFIVSLSLDGENFTEVGRDEVVSAKTEQPDVRTYAWEGEARNAKYVRVQALPSDFGGWVFTDEIVVK